MRPPRSWSTSAHPDVGKVLSLSPVSLTLSPNTNGSLSVSLEGVAPGELRPLITLSSSDPSVAAVPSDVTIPPGETTATIRVTAGGVNGRAVITASGAGSTPGSATVDVGPGQGDVSRIVEWIKDASGSWDDPTNWSIGEVPGEAML